MRHRIQEASTYSMNKDSHLPTSQATGCVNTFMMYTYIY